MTLRQISASDFDGIIYDERADVLYLTVGEPKEPAAREATEQGHLVSYDEDGKVIAITLVNAKWLAHHQGGVRLPIRSAGELKFSASELEAALDQILG
jgi:uncharacterized protein YuzE